MRFWVPRDGAVFIRPVLPTPSKVSGVLAVGGEAGWHSADWAVATPGVGREMIQFLLPLDGLPGGKKAAGRGTMIQFVTG